MSLSIFLDYGLSAGAVGGEGWRYRLLSYWGRRLAVRHSGVSVAGSSFIHPDARIHPRGGQLTIGARSAIAPGACVQGEVSIGEDCTVQAYSMVLGVPGTGPVTIGDGVRIAPHTMIFAVDHIFSDTESPIFTQGVKATPITIEDDVWIAGKVMITPGVRVGHGSVIAAGAVVTKDVPAYSVVAGVPARVIKNRKATQHADTGLPKDQL